jgi:hypothetical protein
MGTYSGEFAKCRGLRGRTNLAAVNIGGVLLAMHNSQVPHFT